MTFSRKSRPDGCGRGVHSPHTVQRRTPCGGAPVIGKVARLAHVDAVPGDVEQTCVLCSSAVRFCQERFLVPRLGGISENATSKPLVLRRYSKPLVKSRAMDLWRSALAFVTIERYIFNSFGNSFVLRIWNIRRRFRIRRNDRNTYYSKYQACYYYK